MKPAVVTPTYNEAANIGNFVSKVFAALPGAVLYVVDDGSPDGTGDMARALDGRPGEVRVIQRGGRMGLGSAYRRGLQEALDQGHEFILQMDADLSHDPMDLPRLLEGCADLSIGSRYVEGGGTVNWPLSRRVLSRGGSAYARRVLGLPYRDLTGGFKCWRAGCLAALDLQSLRSDGYVFQVETTWRAHRLGFYIREVPIVFTERSAGQSKMNSNIALEAALRVPALRFAG